MTNTVYIKNCSKCNKEIKSLYIDQLNNNLFIHERSCKTKGDLGGANTSETSGDTPTSSLQ